MLQNLSLLSMFPVIIVIALQFSRKRASQAFDAKLVSAAQIARQGVNAKMLQQLPLQLIAKSLNTVLQIQNIFYEFDECICPNSKRYLSKFRKVFVQIKNAFVQISICSSNCQAGEECNNAAVSTLQLIANGLNI